MLLPDKMAVAPKFAIRPTRKIEIINWFNESRTAKLARLRYPERLINSRRLDRIVQDLEELLSRRNERLGPSQIAERVQEKEPSLKDITSEVHRMRREARRRRG